MFLVFVALPQFLHYQLVNGSMVKASRTTPSGNTKVTFARRDKRSRRTTNKGFRVRAADCVYSVTSTTARTLWCEVKKKRAAVRSEYAANSRRHALTTRQHLKHVRAMAATVGHEQHYARFVQFVRHLTLVLRKRGHALLRKIRKMHKLQVLRWLRWFHEHRDGSHLMGTSTAMERSLLSARAALQMVADARFLTELCKGYPYKWIHVKGVLVSVVREVYADLASRAALEEYYWNHDADVDNGTTYDELSKLVSVDDVQNVGEHVGDEPVQAVTQATVDELDTISRLFDDED